MVPAFSFVVIYIKQLILTVLLYLQHSKGQKTCDLASSLTPVQWILLFQNSKKKRRIQVLVPRGAPTVFIRTNSCALVQLMSENHLDMHYSLEIIWTCTIVRKSSGHELQSENHLDMQFSLVLGPENIQGPEMTHAVWTGPLDIWTGPPDVWTVSLDENNIPTDVDNVQIKIRSNFNVRM